MPVWGKKKNKLSRADSLDEDVSPPHKPKKKNSIKRLLPYKNRKKSDSKSKDDSHIGEITKPVVAPSESVGSTNTTPVKENKKNSSLNALFHSKSNEVKSPENSPTVTQSGSDLTKNQNPHTKSHSFSSSETVDSEYFESPDSPPGMAALNEDPDFIAQFDGVVPSFSEDAGHLVSTESNHLKRLKSLSKYHLDETSNIHKNKNNRFANTTKALGDDLTVSTVTSAFANQWNNNQPGIYIPQFPEINNSHSRREANENTSSPNINTQNLYEDQRRKDKLISLTRSALRRASNRFSLPAHLAKKWNVEISAPMKDANTSQYSFSVLIREPKIHSALQNTNPIDPPTATAKRTLQDFCWLEQALRNEFHGGLLVPLLSTSLGINGWLAPTGIEKWNKMPSYDILKSKIDKLEMERIKEAKMSKMSKEKNPKKDLGLINGKVPIEKILSDWLSDVLNGIRGHGELIMHLPNINIFHCESMETFLFRNIDPLPTLPTNQSQLQYMENGDAGSNTVGLHDNKRRNSANDDGSNDHWFFRDMVQKSILCFTPAQNGGRNNPVGNGSDGKPRINAKTVNLPLVDMLQCSPRHNLNNSNIHGKISEGYDQHAYLHDKKTRKPLHQGIHTELINAQTDLLFNYRKLTLRCLSQIKDLLVEEDQRSNAWKRLAIALTNLFAFEKDIEKANVGKDSKNKDSPKSNRSRTSKHSLESGLRHLSRQKKDRTIPSLKVLKCMLEAYVEDLYMVKPSHTSQTNAMNKITDTLLATEQEGEDSNQGWDSHIKQLSQKIIHVKQQINEGKNFNELNLTSLKGPINDRSSRITDAYKRAQEDKLLTNEELFKTSLTMLIKSTPFRFARMGWTFFKLELVQSSLLKGRAVKLRGELSKNLVNEEDKLYFQQEEKDDDEFEIQLLQKIAKLGEVDDSTEVSMKKIPSFQSEKVLSLASERVGRWNASLAMCVMEAAGVEDAEVRVEEFTRDLRMVRKYAISLREKVERCVEAVEALMVVTVGDVEDMEENIELMDGDNDFLGLRRTVSVSSSYEPSSISSQIPLYQRSRNKLLSNLALVFSGAQIDTSPDRPGKKLPNTEALMEAGIDIKDSVGWLSALTSGQRRMVGITPVTQRRGNCGQTAATYFKVREANVSDLLSRISKMLREYMKRVEGIESFVYMHCVGIQLEKHFSRNRGKLVEAWEKKTDITTAINIATKKGLVELVDELNAKLAGMSYVSHTAVIQAKEKHKTSKNLKNDLRELADRRFQRAKENAIERITSIIQMWLEHEEVVALEEMKALGETIREIERTVTEEEIKADGGAHLFAFVK